MTVGSQAAQEQILPALARVRSILDEVHVETRRTATEHDLLAAWYAKRGEVDAARLERHAAAVQRLRLAELDAAFDALDKAAVAALDLEPAPSPPAQDVELAGLAEVGSRGSLTAPATSGRDEQVTATGCVALPDR